MFRCVFIVAFFLLTVSAVTRRNIDQAQHESCIHETGMNPEIINPTKHNMTESIINDPKTRCYLACVWKANHYINEEGFLNVSQIVQNMRQDLKNLEEIRRVYTDCARDKGSTDCETAANGFLCFKRHEALLDT